MAKKRKDRKEHFHPDLNAEQKAYVAQLNQLSKEMAEAQGRYHQLKAKCVHVIGYTIDHLFGDDEGDTYCTLCHYHFGHYCPESPDHTCHYFTEDGKIKLVTGVEVDVPKDHLDEDGKYDPNWETDDSCLFCGSPEERK